MDAYSYIGRGHVFSNALTGNLILLSIHISEAQWELATHYLYPTICFASGIALAEIVRAKVGKRLHWRQVSVLAEAVILMYVSTLSSDYNLLANSLTSFACGIQVESFRKILGCNIATTMCLGNTRSATQYLVFYFREKNPIMLRRSMVYYIVIAFFCLGALLGYKLVTTIGLSSIMVCSIFLLMAFSLMFIDIQEQNAEVTN